MKVLKSFSIIINFKAVLVSILAVISTFLCHYIGLRADFPLTLVGIAIVFPIVFSIDSAYKRRESALEHYAELKANAFSLYLAARDWVRVENDSFPGQMKDKLVELLVAVQSLLSSPKKDNGLSAREKEVYDKFSELSEISIEFRRRNLAAGELSRASQYISLMIQAFDQMKNIFYYRTPITLRAYSKVFIYTFPVLYGPYFALTMDTYSAGLSYMMPILYSFILVSLDNIQDHLENPYDDIGEDDIRMDVKGFTRLMD